MYQVTAIKIDSDTEYLKAPSERLHELRKEALSTALLRKPETQPQQDVRKIHDMYFGNHDEVFAKFKSNLQLDEERQIVRLKLHDQAQAVATAICSTIARGGSHSIFGTSPVEYEKGNPVAIILDMQDDFFEASFLYMATIYFDYLYCMEQKTLETLDDFYTWSTKHCACR